MKKNIGKDLKDVKGITLVALVVTIIVLLILAGVALSSVLSQDGIFHRAEQAVDKHGEAKARETLELALGEAQMQKYDEGLTDEQLTEKINAIGEELPKEKPEHPELQNVIVDGHIFEIDRSVPKIVDYIGPADGVIITAQITQNGDWQNPVATVKGTITKYGGGSVTNTTVTATNGVTIPADFPTTGGSFTISNITTDTDITITASADDGKPAVTKTIKVRLVRDATGPIITSFEAKAEGLKITISARAEDNESGMQSLTYNITSNQDTTLVGIAADKRTGTLTNEPITIETTPTGNRDETTYKITVTAKDNANNPTTVEKDVKTEDVVYKHINTTEGLKTVKAKDIYGSDILGYNCERDDVEWQLFYIDEDDNHRVYLIAKDYADPPVKNATPTLYPGGDSRYPKAYRFGTSQSDSSIISKFKGTIQSTLHTQKFLKEAEGKDDSIGTINYMLNQEIWKEYKNTAKADEATGGPALKLFINSFNDTCSRTEKLECNCTDNTNGGYYKLTLGVGESAGNGTFSKTFTNPDRQKEIYFKGGISIGNASGFRLIAYNDASAGCVWSSHYTGYLHRTDYWNIRCRFPTNSFSKNWSSIHR